MTVLKVIQDVCTKIGLDVPQAVFSSTEREHMELAALANEMAERIAEASDWQKLTVEQRYIGDAVEEAFDLPADYDRMITNGNVWNSRTNNPVDPLTHNAWLGREVRGFDVYSAYLLLEDQMRIRPIMAVNEFCLFYYISNSYVVAVEDGTEVHRDCFTADDDNFVLPERLLRLGMIWQWRESNGLDYAEDMANYEKAMAQEVKSERGSKVLLVGGRELSGYKTAYPQAIVS